MALRLNCQEAWGSDQDEALLHNFRGTMPAYRWYFPSRARPDFVLVRESNAVKRWSFIMLVALAHTVTAIA